MIVFETFQTVPLLALRDMDPYMDIQEKKQDFPIAGEDFNFVRLDLSLALIKHPEATFFIQMTNDQMVEEGIMPGDVMIVDRLMVPKHNALAVVYFEGEFIAAKLLINDNGIRLQLHSPEPCIVEIEPDMTFSIWGIIRDVLHMDGKMLE